MALGGWKYYQLKNVKNRYISKTVRRINVYVYVCMCVYVCICQIVIRPNQQGHAHIKPRPFFGQKPRLLLGHAHFLVKFQLRPRPLLGHAHLKPRPLFS